MPLYITDQYWKRLLQKQEFLSPETF